MKHYIYAMDANAPSLAGRGTVREWFELYKLDNGPDVFVPFPEESLPVLPFVGDVVWFAMDGQLVGFATITDVRADQFNGKVEIVYDSDAVHRVEATPDLKWFRLFTGEAPDVRFFNERYLQLSRATVAGT